MFTLLTFVMHLLFRISSIFAIFDRNDEHETCYGKPVCKNKCRQEMCKQLIRAIKVKQSCITCLSMK